MDAQPSLAALPDFMVANEGNQVSGQAGCSTVVTSLEGA